MNLVPIIHGTTETETDFVFTWIVIRCVGYTCKFPSIIESTTMHNLFNPLFWTLGVVIGTN